MGFSRAQHGLFRPLVIKAWQVHCKANAMNARDLAAKNAWYREELRTASGKTSSADLDQTRAFEKVMAHFEAIAGDSIHWQMRLFRGNARRILHQINQISREHDLDEDYLRAIAKQALQTDFTPELHDLRPETLLTILNAARVYVRRHLKSEPINNDDPY